MLQKMEIQQLQTLSLEQIKSYEAEVVKRKAELEEAKGSKNWNSAMQDELNEIAILLVDIDEVIESLNEKLVKYVPAEGTEKMVHLSIVRGRRFNPMTGVEETKPYTQLFTFAEWQLFKKNFKGLGFVIIEVLHDPYGDAAELVAGK